MKTLVSFVLIFAMLVPLSLAVAADSTSAPPTVEEILSEYHQKAFERDTEDAPDAVTTWSLRGTTKTLEEETIDNLTSAGYDAYNVTNENYETVEDNLNTDLVSMGLEPDSSYIVVVSGEDSNEASVAGAPPIDNIDPLPSEDQAPDGGLGDSYFYYTYEGTTYLMRYVTVSELSNPGQFKEESFFVLNQIERFDEIAGVFTEYALTAVADQLAEEGAEIIPVVGTVYTVTSLVVDLYGAATQSPAQEMDCGSWTMRLGTTWVRTYTQVYNEVGGYWETTQCSTYAESLAEVTGPFRINEETGSLEPTYSTHTKVTYSPYYNKTELRKTRAVIAYLSGTRLFDFTGSINYYFTNEHTGTSEPFSVFVDKHTENATYKHPEKEYD